MRGVSFLYERAKRNGKFYVNGYDFVNRAVHDGVIMSKSGSLCLCFNIMDSMVLHMGIAWWEKMCAT